MNCSPKTAAATLVLDDFFDDIK